MDEGKEYWQTRKVKAEALKYERALEVVNLDYVPRKEVEDVLVIIGNAFSQMLSAARGELPALVDGQSAVESEKTIEEWSDQWEDKIVDLEGELWTRAREAVQRELAGEMKKVARSQARRAKEDEQK